jgi:hypothetical protein
LFEPYQPVENKPAHLQLRGESAQCFCQCYSSDSLPTGHSPVTERNIYQALHRSFHRYRCSLSSPQHSWREGTTLENNLLDLNSLSHYLLICHRFTLSSGQCLLYKMEKRLGRLGRGQNVIAIAFRNSPKNESKISYTVFQSIYASTSTRIRTHRQ